MSNASLRPLRAALVALPLLALAGAAGAQSRWETQVTKIASGEWTGPRLPDGQPDVQGHWSNTIGNHDNFTDPQGGIPGDVARAGGGGAGAIGTQRTERARAPSRVSDPADGQVPFQPWARALQQEFLANFFDPTKAGIHGTARALRARGSDEVLHVARLRDSPVSRATCCSCSIPARESFTSTASRTCRRTSSSGTATRAGIGKATRSSSTSTNNNAKARLGRTGEFASDNVHIEERYIFDESGERYTYEAVYTDPTVFTRPWTVTIPAKKYTEDSPQDDWHNQTWFAASAKGERLIEAYERTCVENNEGHGEVAIAAADADADADAQAR